MRAAMLSDGIAADPEILDKKIADGLDISPETREPKLDKWNGLRCSCDHRQRPSTGPPAASRGCGRERTQVDNNILLFELI